MGEIAHYHTRFWSTDRSLTVLLGLLFINIFILQPLTELGIFRAFFVPDVLFSLILISGVMAVAKSRFITVLALVFALVTLVVRWGEDIYTEYRFSYSGCLTSPCVPRDARGDSATTGLS